ncbi:poly-gamma-glutamate biosynthesis protein PgsC/CapC [Halovibrio sp. HP20-50]|uniref:poly-gamma-glutamate biosynthesis protein PgsC/CapC n=1 Tax=Halovibrio sp. HP20-59 TaxID=3080275 RepID=UPI00294B8524|nr:poly-gamma-glutamate biosynthesis protein PgsC/CapC [Halovibrio sp. HP20-59]MEA2117835.1 poly-gamma-glutamate biosynthesis protein PgsC/CapC [Halovibrio sp. HP20-59]
MNWDLLPFHIFPEGSLASSVITTVWVGVAVVAFFNLRFGWSLAGLVVPGYLVPLLLIKPWSVAVIIGEGMVTYLVVHVFSLLGARYLGLADFFGRDRFFALVLTSVIVRVVFDAYWLPGLGAFLDANAGLEFDYANNLHSFGLIIVALIANNFWKPGIVRGTFWLLVTLAATFALVRFGLMELTNFSVSNLNYLYEDVASSILASPKAYIILLTTAFIASRMNLHYAWEFNGILIPSLLALQWYQPTKLLLTFAEVAVILTAAHLLLKLPFFGNINLSGARKLFFFFSVGFAYKLLLGYGFQFFAPWIKVTDFFAFGYLISTLLALKMHDKDIGIRVTRATLQTSLTAVVVASFVGFSLSFIPAQLIEEGADTQALVTPPETQATLGDVLLRQRVVDYGVVGRENLPQPSGVELARFQAALLALKRYQREGDAAELDQARRGLSELNYALSRVEERYLVLSEVGAPRGWGTFVIDTRPESRLVVEIPAAIDERGITEAGLALFRDQQAAALAVSSVRLRESTAGTIDVTRNPGSFFHQFHQAFGPGNALQVRLITRIAARALLGGRAPETSNLLSLPSQLRVKQALPDDLKLQSLERLLGELTLRWEAPDIPNVQRERTRSGFAELYLNPDSLRPLLARSHRQGASATPMARHEGALSDYLLERTAMIREVGREDFRPPSLEELLFLDLEVLSPLLELAVNGPQGRWSEDTLNELRYLNDLARGLGYRITRFHDRTHDQHYLILENTQDATPTQPWGTLVVASGGASSQLVQVPRPRFERNTLEAGTQLFQTLKAGALLIAGSHPFLDPAGNSDVLSPRNQRSVFNLVHQVYVREAEGAPLLVTQVRGMGERENVQAPSLLAFADGLRPEAAPLPLRERLRRSLESMGLAPKELLGDELTAGYEVGSNAQTRYLAAARNTDFATVWIAPSVRSAFALPSDDRQQQVQFQALEVETLDAPLKEQVARYGLPKAPLPEGAVSLLEHYVKTDDIVALRILQHRGYRLARALDPDSRQAFLLVAEANKARSILAIANLNPLSQAVTELAPNSPWTGEVEDFIDRRSFLLRAGVEQ